MIEFPATEQRNAFLKAWIEQRLQSNLGQCACLGVWRDERLIAVCAFNNFKIDTEGPRSIELNFAADSPRWASKQVVTWILSYPFVQLQVTRVTALTKKSNKRARKLLLGVGFAHEGTHRHAAENLEAVMSYGLVKADFESKYLLNLENSHRKQITTGASAAR